jgi:hypothetical protein
MPDKGPTQIHEPIDDAHHQAAAICGTITITLSAVPRSERHPHGKADNYIPQHGKKEQLHRGKRSLGGGGSERCLADDAAANSVLPRQENQDCRTQCSLDVEEVDEPPSSRHCQDADAAAIASSKKLLAPVRADGPSTQCCSPDQRFGRLAKPALN